jgi:hypothetical protein
MFSKKIKFESLIKEKTTSLSLFADKLVYLFRFSFTQLWFLGKKLF